MRKWLEKNLPDNHRKRQWLAIGVTVVVAGLLTLWGIYGIGQYGIALFVFTPLYLGAGSTLLYGLKKELSLREAWQIGMIALGVFTALLLIFAMEGLICIAMAAPFGGLLASLGSYLGYVLLKEWRQSGTTAMLVFISAIPSTALVEQGASPPLTSVVSYIDIQAEPEVVWKYVVAFPQLPEPQSWLFKAGIAYPIHAKIDGSGVGAIRHCNFNTGSFVEPITIWNPPHLLKFDVLEQPAPMKELSFWDVDAPHLHDYFVSKQGQFKLIALPNHATRLEGTTWYYHNIQPAFYWQLWSNLIIHRIHLRVLEHIKNIAELETHEQQARLSQASSGNHQE